MPVHINLSDYGALFGGNNDTTAWVNAINDLNANNGGTIIADGAGASVCNAPWPLLVKNLHYIKIKGLGKYVTRVQFQGFTGTCIGTVNDDKDLEGFQLQDIGLRHTQGATIINFDNGRFKDSEISNVYVSQKTDSAETAIIISGGLASEIKNLTINGGHSGGTGIDFRGTHCVLDKIFCPDKDSSPSNFMKLRLVNSTVTNCRTEGGNGDYDYYIYDSDHVRFNAYSEGYLSDVGLKIEDSNGIYITGALGTQISQEPIGVQFINSLNCTIDYFKMSARHRNVIFDENSVNNRILYLKIIKTNFHQEKKDIWMPIGEEGLYNSFNSQNRNGGERIYTL